MTATEIPAIFATLVTEITQKNRHGRILVAIDGPEEDSSRRFAGALAEAARSAGTATFRASAERPEGYASNDDASSIRALLVGFRNGALEYDNVVTDVPDDAMLIVDGRFLQSPRLRGAWHFRVWIEGNEGLSESVSEQHLRYVRDAEPRESADAIYDFSGAIPLRTFADSC